MEDQCKLKLQRGSLKHDLKYGLMSAKKSKFIVIFMKSLFTCFPISSWNVKNSIEQSPSRGLDKSHDSPSVYTRLNT